MGGINRGRRGSDGGYQWVMRRDEIEGLL